MRTELLKELNSELLSMEESKESLTSEEITAYRERINKIILKIENHA